MKLERLKDVQMSELMRWAENLEDILTPDKLNPAVIKDYPSYIETSERLKRICDWMARDIKDKMQNIEDVHLDRIESVEYIFKHNAGGMPVFKKKFNTVEKRQRELRFRLKEDEEYQRLDSEQRQWKIMYSDWVSHVKRLNKEFDLLEITYASNGGEGVGI